MPTATCRADQTVTWAELARELGISRPARQRILDAGLVTPVHPPHPGYQTELTADEAERIRKAWLRAAAIGVGLIVVLRVLSGGAGSP
jgi:hypothetical protein